MGPRESRTGPVVRSTVSFFLLLLLPQRARGFATAGASLFPAGTVDPALGPRIAFVRCRAPRQEEFSCEWGVRGDLGGELEEVPAELQHSRLLYAFYDEEEEDGEEGVMECPSSREPHLERTPGGLLATFRCRFPERDVIHFTPLRITIPRERPGAGVGATARLSPLYHADRVYIDQLVLVDPPGELAVRSDGRQGRLRASWAPAPGSDFALLFQLRYERVTEGGLATPEPTATPHEKTAYNTSAELHFPDEEAAMYRFRVRARPSDQSQYAGPWSAWSPAVTAAPPFVTGKLDVRCFTADLLFVVCEWQGARAANLSGTFFTASYRLGGGRTQPCAAEWQREKRDEEVERGPTWRCGFPVHEDSAVLVTVNASNANGRHEVQLGPFLVRQQVRPGPPVNVSAEPDGSAGDVTVAWGPPSQELSEHLHYELRYIADNSSVWKLVSVGRAEGGYHRLHSLRAGPGYLVQVRARPDGVSLAGEWGAWSSPVSVKPRAPTDGAAWIIRALAVVALLLLLLMALGAALAHAGRIKEHVWPPIPSLETHFAGLFQRWLGESYEVGCTVTADSDAQVCVVEVLSELTETSPMAGRKEVGTMKIAGETAMIDVFEGKIFDDLGKEIELPLLIESAPSLVPKAVTDRGAGIVSPPPLRNNNNNNKDASVARLLPSATPLEDDLSDRRASPGTGNNLAPLPPGGDRADEASRTPCHEYVWHGHALSLWPGPPFSNGNFSNLAYVPPLESPKPPDGADAGGGGDVAVATLEAASTTSPRSTLWSCERSRQPSSARTSLPATSPGRHSYVNCARRPDAPSRTAPGRRDACGAANGHGDKLLPYVNQSLESSM
ncbi:thrombopoietin receptor [Petromyzon marinus]|uniref:Thrombopoietin receptor n=1 Tax=Petromyzon marinus TaxID=7757 RepID=A0AAJ7TQI6_PETMA|nr:thrombopoietin receptor [Petromyzon marinus]